MQLHGNSLKIIKNYMTVLLKNNEIQIERKDLESRPKKYILYSGIIIKMIMVLPSEIIKEEKIFLRFWTISPESYIQQKFGSGMEPK